ncbi:MAG: hypothetical protein GY737_24120 [Desulfobacteraceae bacterium]|nr:hypothetical protein [Desulfobacteraceae bacterium]
MKLKVFTFQFSEKVAGFNDKSLQEFISDKEVIEFTEHFFVHEKTPYLTILISYRDAAMGEGKPVREKTDPRKELDEREKTVYEALRAWRAAVARQEGIPPYMVANNRQIAKMVRIKARTRTMLAGIQGFGETKVNKYGNDILRIIAEHQPVENQPEKGPKEISPS